MKFAQRLTHLVLVASLASPASEDVGARFSDVAARSGIRFQHDNTSSPRKLLIETMGAGCAWLDYDNDGWLDAFFVNSGPTVAYKPEKPPRNALYRNNGDGTFSDVTEPAGVAGAGGFYMGIAAADYDNDGYTDLYVTGVGQSVLYHNERNGRFVDVTARAGVENAGMWGSSAAFFDFDNDGLLDLMVINYLDWSPNANVTCEVSGAGSDSYCHPKTYRGLPARLYRNAGDGVFEDVSQKSGIGKLRGRGLGIVAFDFNNDGRMDVFVANDAMENFLWRNNGNGTFSEVALEVGVAYSEEGLAEAGMGVDAADLNHDGQLDLVVTHYHYELNRLYISGKDGKYQDATVPWGLARQVQRSVGFGTRFLDYDNDGLQDLVVINGHVIDNIDRYMPRITYAQSRQLYRNTGSSFVEVSAAMGKEFVRPRVGRGLAVGDFDNDGYPDLLVSNNGGPAELLRNEGEKSNHWIGLRLIGAKSNRDGIGAKIAVQAGGRVRHFQKTGGGSYLSASEARLLIGLGAGDTADAITISWPSGITQTLRGLTVNHYYTVKESSGKSTQQGA